MKTSKLFAGTIVGLTLLVSTSAYSSALQGTKTINLLEEDGTKHPIGSIAFKPDGKDVSYEILWDHSNFGDHFLSMRPFRCLEGSKKYWCQVPYPYEIKRKIIGGDLTDLEYDLLFIWKGSKEYGINMWNGVYYQLEMEGDKITGSINEMDMDKLSAPPDDGSLRPVRDVDLEPGEPSSHWLPGVVIE